MDGNWKQSFDMGSNKFTGGDNLFGAWNLFSYSFRDIENTADITWLYGKGLCICIGLILLLALPKIVRKRG